MEFIRYILGDFWHFLGFVILFWMLLNAIGNTVIYSIRAFKGLDFKEKKDDNSIMDNSSL